MSTVDNTDQEYYNGIGLGGDTLDTIILSGGGYFGLGYFGLFRFLDEAGLRAGIRHVYGVSAGAIVGIMLAIGMTAAECRKLILDGGIDLSQLIQFNTRLLLNIPDRLGMNDGQYLVDVCKRLLQDKGLSEYCTFQELYEQCGVELHLGVSLVLRNEFQIWDRHTRPDMPLWQAIRASSAIPIVFMPVIDYEAGDFVCDGGIMNSNLIGSYLRQRVKSYLQPLQPHELLSAVKIPGRARSVGCQAGGADDGKVYLDEQLSDNSTQTDIPALMDANRPRYRQTFWCVELDIRRFKVPQTQQELEAVDIGEYLNAVIYKIFILQDSHRHKFRRLLQVINCNRYDYITFTNLQISATDFDHLENDFYQQAHDYYYSRLLNKPLLDTTSPDNTSNI